MSRASVKTISGAEVRRMASIGCTQPEIAQRFGVCIETIMNNFHLEYQEGISCLHELIRQGQIDCALYNKGNAGMLIFMGKCILKQKEQTTEDRLADLDLLLKHLDSQAECSNYLANNFKATQSPAQE